MKNVIIYMDFSIAWCNIKNNLFWGSVMDTMFSKSCYVFWYILLGQILLLMLDGELSLHGPLVSLPPASETLICFTFLCCCFFPCHLVQGRSLLTLFSGSCCHGEENSTIPQLILSIRVRRIFLPSLHDFHFIAVALKSNDRPAEAKS